MKIYFLAVLFLAGIVSCGQVNKQDSDSKILASQTADRLNRICIPGKQVGAIISSTSEKDLINIYGKNNVVRHAVSLGEGFFENGTFLFPNTKNELHITWKDTINYQKPNAVYIRKPKSDWKTNTNIGIGTSLKELEKINGKEFKMMGFEWDYSGTISDWNNGKLANNKDSIIEPDFIVRMHNEGEVRLSAAEYEKLMGDDEILSSEKTLQKLNPKVRELIIFLNK